MNPSRGSSLFIILSFILAACSQLPTPNSSVLESQVQVTETQKITARRAKFFGSSVAIDGNFMVIGTDTYGPEPFFQATAYLYQRDTSGRWRFIKRLATDGASSGFGYPVAISGNTVVIGAYSDRIGINFQQGSAFIFERDQGGLNNWGEVKKLVASNGTAGDFFGHSVAISGNTIVVGADGDNVGPHLDQGSAYIFFRNRGGTNAWGQVKRLSYDGAADDRFGTSVAISGNTVVVGAFADEIGINFQQGSASIFERDQGGLNKWGEVKKLIASDGAADDRFGYSVAISGNTVVVGAFTDAIGANFAQGSAYIFERDQGGLNTWGRVKKLIASDGADYDHFGYSVAISSRTVVVGANGDNSAYTFERDQGGVNRWRNVKKLLASDGADGALGHSVAISSDTIVVGAYLDASDTNIRQGSAYIY